MKQTTILMKKKLLIFLFFATLGFCILIGRLIYIEVTKGDELRELALEQQTRDRLIAANRGAIYDRNGIGIAMTETVNSISVIPVQVKEKESTALYLSEKLDVSYESVLEKVQQNVALVRIKTRVDTALAMEIREEGLAGVMIDEGVQRVYPYGEMASHVIGFVGSDNQGILGLEAKYNEQLQGSEGKILTLTDSRGNEVESQQERIAPVDGENLVLTLDVTLQQYAEQILEKAVETKQAAGGAIIALNPQNGEIYAMANYPNFDLNDPFTINDPELAMVWSSFAQEEKNDYLNQMWRNGAVSDTYEPGSTFKMITSAAALEEDVVEPSSTFYCSGAHIVQDRRIKCWKSPLSHGSQTFTEGVQNSCNPVFMVLGERLGAATFLDYMDRFGFNEKTGVDLAGEAVGIMHKLENMGPVELATTSFGQSFQITPLQLLRSASAIVNGGNLITPHFAKGIADEDGDLIEEFTYPLGEQVISTETSEQMKEILEQVVENGTGNKTYLAGYRLGGKTATSEKLPRGSGKYIASFLAFAPAENPEFMALILIDEPQGVYYGGTVVGPLMQEVMLNALPYLGIDPIYSEEEQKALSEIQGMVPEVVGKSVSDAKNTLYQEGFQWKFEGLGDLVVKQIPPFGEVVNKNTEILLYLEEKMENLE
ncbi:MAG: penicillin-binding transpeptidase domain-containing protein [Bacillota bacterium]